MEFDYEISADDYAAAQILSLRLNHNYYSGAWWFFGGLFLILLCLIERDRGWSPVLLGALGVWCVWVSISRTFPGKFSATRFHKRYRQLGLEARKYHARVDASGFEVIGEQSTWRMRWADITLKGEDNRVFIFYYPGGVIFIFGKRYMDEKQQQSLRSFGGLSPG